MKRKALLLTSGFTVKQFEGCAARDDLPFSIGRDRWSDYSIEQAVQLRIMKLAADGMDNTNAALLARGAFDKLWPLSPFAYTDGEDLWVGLVRYEWSNAPEGWDCRAVIAGRWSDLSVEAAQYLSGFEGGAELVSITAISASKAARDVWTEARELGLPEGDQWPKCVSENLDGYPEWFQEIERARREVVFG